MTLPMMNRLMRWGGARWSRRAARTMPIVGVALAAVAVVGTMKRKGVLRGGLDTALNATPLLGAMKNIAESVRGRDFIADRPVPVRKPVR